MTPTLAHRMDILARRILPSGSTLFLLLLSLAPTRIPGFSGIVPLLVLGAVFYWAVNRPDLLPFSLSFVFGFLQDVLAGTPVGVMSLVLVIVQWAATSQRRLFAKSFLLAWWGFAVAAAGGITIAWALTSIFHSTLVPPTAPFFQFLMTAAVFPFVMWLFARLEIAMLREV
jgi:rod shape-determining protein MreD